MTRKNFLKGLIGLFWPLTAFGAKKVCFPVQIIWDTPQGQYVLALRGELKRLDHWDDLDEDWKLVEDALRNGHMFFQVMPSRSEKTKLLYRVCPVFYEKQIYGNTETLATQIL